MENHPGNVLIVVQCRYGSSRLPGKALAELAGRPMLGFLLRRLAPCAAGPGVEMVLATTERDDDDQVAALGRDLGLPVFRGAVDDVLGRYLACLENFPASHVVRVTADNPLTCPQMLNQCLDALREHDPDYLTVEGLPLGAAVDGFAARTLRAMDETRDPDEREHINLRVLRNPEQYRTMTLRAPARMTRPDLRMTVDTPEDLARVASIFTDQDKTPWDLDLEQAIARMNGQAATPAPGHTPKWRPFSQWAQELFTGGIPRRLAIRVDAARETGLSFGHLSRCLVMAQVLREQGCESIFLMRAEPPFDQGADLARAKGFTVHAVEERNTFTQTLVLCRDLEAPWLLTDLPYEDLDVKALEDAGLNIVFVDDCRFLFPKVRTVLNSSVLASGKAPEPGQGPDKCLLGPGYFILEEQPKKARPKTGKSIRVLLTFGGSDPTGLTPRVLQALSGRDWYGVEFTLVLGPGYQGQSEAEELAAEVPDCAVLTAPEDLLGLMAGHDLVVCAGGRTMYEAWALGIPFAPVASAAHETREIRAFREQGLTSHGLEEWDDHEFITTMKCLLGRKAA